MPPIDEKLDELVAAIDLLIEQTGAEGHADPALIELLIQMQDLAREWLLEGSTEDRHQALARLSDSFKAKLTPLVQKPAVLH